MTSKEGRRKQPIVHVVSAGGVVYRVRDGRMEVVLCGNSVTGVWGLPKGTPNAGESLEATALREVEEETGLQVRIVDKVGSIRYWFSRGTEGIRYHKVVHYYLMAPIGGDISQHDQEFDSVQWFTANEACRILTYKNEVEMVRQAVALLEQGEDAQGI